MKANKGAHNHHGFYENKIPGKSWLLSPIEQQDRPAFFVDDKLVSDIKAQSSIHKHFLDESDRHDAMKDVISKKTGKSLPHVLDSISKFGANLMLTSRELIFRLQKYLFNSFLLHPIWALAVVVKK